MLLSSCTPAPTAPDPVAPAPVDPSASPAAPEPSVDAQFFATASELLDDAFDHDPLRAVFLGLHKYDGRIRDASAAGLAAERAAARSGGPGSFKVALFDELPDLKPATLAECARIVGPL